MFAFAGCAAGAPESGYYAIDHFEIRGEGEVFREAMDSLTVSTYEWYKLIEGEDGVYIMHYDLYPALYCRKDPICLVL